VIDGTGPEAAANDAGTQSGSASGGMDDIVRRLDALLRTVAEAPSPVPAPSSFRSGKLEAAKREWESRRLRERLFGAVLFGDCAWDIVLDLFIAQEEGREVTLAGVCQATELDESVVLRSLATLIEAGLIIRLVGASHLRGVNIALSEAALARLCDYFNEVR